MAILSGYQKIKKYVKESSGMRLLSHWTHASTVEFDDGTTLDALASGLGDASKKDVDTEVTASSISTNLPTSKAVAELVSKSISASDAMVFKGTIGTAAGDTYTDLPTSKVTIGDTYKITTGGTYAGVVAKVGDLFIALTSAPTWTHVPAGDETVSVSQTVTTGTEIGAVTVNGGTTKLYAPTIPTSLPANGGTAENVSGTVAVANGGTGATTASDARTNLGLGSAAVKAVDTSISAASTSANLPTSAAVASFVEGKGYKTTDNNTTYSLTQDASNGHKITLTPSSGTAQTITIPDNNTWIAFAGASASAAGTAGYVPAPGTGNQAKFFRGDGTWQSVLAVTEATGSLGANVTSLAISNSAITTSSTIDVYSSVFGVNPTGMTVAAGKVTLTFSSSHVAATIKVRIS